MITPEPKAFIDSKRGKVKADWSTPANQELLRTAVHDWDNHKGEWRVGDTFAGFGAKYGIPRVMMPLILLWLMAHGWLAL